MEQNLPNKRQEEISSYLEVLRFLNESVADYLFLMDCSTGKIYFPNPIYEQFNLPEDNENGYTLEDWSAIVYPRDLPPVIKELQLIREGKQNFQDMNYRLIDRSGKRLWINCRAKLRYYEDGKPLMLVGRVSNRVFGDKVDSLTGLLGSHRFVEDITAALQDKKNGCLLVLDLDNFKNVNIKYGRTYGDNLLLRVTEILETSVDPSFLLYRLSGDRFAVNLIGKDADYARYVYRSIQEPLAKHCTLSAGALLYDKTSPTDGATLYQYLENALDHAKSLGKSNLFFFSEEYYASQRSAIELQNELRQSVLNGFEGFSLCYQPQISCTTYGIYGLEALLRYHSPSRGPISPVEFIPLLEQNELIMPIGKWVLETAAAACVKWRRDLPGLHISVNLSYAQLREEGIAENILEILESSGLPPQALTLELTESAQLQDYQHYNQIFHRWKKAGILLSIDDFGTGYSSLSYLKNLEIDEIKIDRCFVRGIQHSSYNYRLLSNILELAHSSHIHICCEGVETDAELLTLRNLQPDILQGYFFAKPYTSEQFEDVYINKQTPAYQNRLKQEAHFLLLKNQEKPSALTIRDTEDLNTIVENMDELVYLSNPVTYELYYLNSAGRQLTGLYDCKGGKCHKILYGFDTPCSFCHTKMLSKDSFFVEEEYNEHLHQHFSMKSKLIPWQQSMARLTIASAPGIVPDTFVNLHFIRQKNFYEAMLSETIAYAEVNLGTGAALTSGGLWRIYKDECQQMNLTFFEVVADHLEHCIAPEDVMRCRDYFDSDTLLTLFQKGICMHRHTFRRYMGNKLRWVELVIHVFKEKYTDEIYTLLYLKDIDTQRRRELAHELAAKTDPLTNVYNHRMFEELVAQFLQQDSISHEGSLILFDIDNFKQINDHYGHIAGDNALKCVTNILKSTFRSQDIIGRMGGDEFLAFVKDVTDRVQLNRLLSELFNKLLTVDEIPITCSAGITFLRGDSYSYESKLIEADRALYRSKQLGKNCAFYYEDMQREK